MDYVASTVQRLLADTAETGRQRLFLISTYVIGKERILLEVSPDPQTLDASP